MDIFIEYAPFLVPLAIAQVALAVIALVHIIRHPNYRFGNKVMWIIIVCCVQLIGPVIYFVFGRGQDS